MHSDIAKADPKITETEDFLNQYEDLWTRFQKLGNDLQVEARSLIISLLQKSA